MHTITAAYYLFASGASVHVLSQMSHTGVKYNNNKTNEHKNESQQLPKMYAILSVALNNTPETDDNATSSVFYTLSQ